jgi:hypothetical protein
MAWRLALIGSRQAFTENFSISCVRKRTRR